MSTKRPIFAWHFTDGMKLRDGQDLVVGKTYTVDASRLDLCTYGLHASVKLIDALQYAPGAQVSRVRLSGKVIKGDDKLCASERTVLWTADASKTLHLFACDVAEKALKAAKVTDACCHEAIRIKRLWVESKATDIELSAARDAAWGAVHGAPRDAAWAAAQDAARAAAWDAARDAAWAAAWDAAWAAAWAARDAAWAAARDAAQDAAWGAAHGASRDAQNKLLTKRIQALKPK